MPVQFKVSTRAREILDRAEFADGVLRLAAADAKLDRPTYEEVNDVLAGAGGKWDRSRRGHVFEDDPRPLISAAIATGVAIDGKQARQAFYTPPEVAAIVVEKAEIRPTHSVLEPSAGRGALATVVPVQRYDQVRCYETDPLCVAVLRELGFPVEQRDFLSVPPAPVYDRVVMNPPFAKGQDIAHVSHALRFLKGGGRLVSIMSGNALTGTSKTHRAFRELLDDSEWWESSDLEGGAFRASGTNVKTLILSVDP